MAEWLNTTFSAIDNGAFAFFNGIAKSASGFFTPFALIFAYLGKGGIGFIILSVILLLFKKTRRAGLSSLIAILVGAIFTNLLIKNLVARERPYVASEEYREFWLFVGGHKESEYSFPSGHVTVCTTSLLAIFFCADKKKFFWLLFVPLIMASTRIYLVVHYLTDVVGGLIVGGVAGAIGYFIVGGIYKSIEKNREKKFCKFILEFDIIKRK